MSELSAQKLPKRLFEGEMHNQIEVVGNRMPFSTAPVRYNFAYAKSLRARGGWGGLNIFFALQVQEHTANKKPPQGTGY